MLYGRFCCSWTRKMKKLKVVYQSYIFYPHEIWTLSFNCYRCEVEIKWGFWHDWFTKLKHRTALKGSHDTVLGMRFKRFLNVLMRIFNNSRNSNTIFVIGSQMLTHAWTLAHIVATRHILCILEYAVNFNFGLTLSTWLITYTAYKSHPLINLLTSSYLFIRYAKIYTWF